MTRRTILLALVLSLIFTSTVGAQSREDNLRAYKTGFETIDDFAGFYIVPQNHKQTVWHEQSRQVVHSGNFSHGARIDGANAPSTVFANNNHRGYPTIQLYKLPEGAFRTPAKIEFWVWLDMDLQKGEWFSFATLDHTRSNRWDPVLVNLSDEGFVHLMHVPTNGRGNHTFQTTSVKFPFRTWVKLSIELHFDRQNGYAKVWQNGILVSSAQVLRGNGEFTQAHFGLYAPPSISSGIVFNDDLTIREIGQP